MRTTNSIKNGIIAMIMYVVTILIGFVTQKIFINILGNEYLGINSLFTNVISMLSIAELGFGTAIIYNLYKHIAENNREEIKSLIKFYKISYEIIALAVTIIGICIIPFINNIVGEVNIQESLYLIYLLFLIDTVASYLLTYKRSILYANQKTYVINIVHIGYLIFMNLLQMIVLYLTQNFILYLIIKIIFRILENVIITMIANIQYPYLKDKKVENISKETKRDIITKVKGLLFHKIGTFIVLGTDNIIISKFLGVIAVGLYSNYYMIIAAVNNLFSQVFTSITATVGNLLIENNPEKSYKIYKNMMLLNSWIFTFAGACLLCLMEPFVKLWIGDYYVLSHIVLIVLVVNFYMQGMRKTYGVFKEAAGIFYEDRFVPIIESLINILASVIFVRLFGLAGVFLGTITSTFILYGYSFPKFVYKRIFKKEYKQYVKDNIKHIIPATISIVITVLIVNKVIISNILLQLIVNGIICVIVPNLIMLLIFYRTDEFKYYKKLVINLIKKRKEKEISNK